MSINCELRVFPVLAINRFANINVHVYYNTVWGRPSQLLDSQFGPTCLERNHAIKTHPTVVLVQNSPWLLKSWEILMYAGDDDDKQWIQFIPSLKSLPSEGLLLNDLHYPTC